MVDDLSVNPVTGYSGAAKRFSDEMNMHVEAGALFRWMAVRLEDGGSDHQTYDSKREAIRHQAYEQQCAYTIILPNGITPRDAQDWIDIHRKLYAAGARLADPILSPVIPLQRT